MSQLEQSVEHSQREPAPTRQNPRSPSPLTTSTSGVKHSSIAVIIVATAVASGALALFVGSQLKSPSEVAAEAMPPPASNITVDVGRQMLSTEIVTRGQVVYEQATLVRLSGSFAETVERLIVTDSIPAGTDLSEGDVMIEVVGRPVFLLRGDIPMYRDLRLGVTGEDVLQLGECLGKDGLVRRGS